MPFLALQGIRVIEAASGIAGPFCGKLMAGYGAEVIKVEAPGIGDMSRQQGPFPGDVPDKEKSSLFLHLNANKKGVTLDLHTTQGQELFRRLLRESHVLIESHRPGGMESFGLGYEALQKLRPDLVMTSVTPFGQTGPHKDYQFTELTIFAMTGAMHREGEPDRHPLRYGGEIAQYFAGTAAAAATMAACLRSSLTGQGEWIDISIQEAMVGHPHQIGRRAPFVYAGELDTRGRLRPRGRSGLETYATGTFHCKDGYVSLLPLGARMWPNIARMIEMPELVTDPRFATSEDRHDRNEELAGMFQGWLDSHTKEEVFTAAQEAGLPCAPVLPVDEVMSDRHLRDRDYFIDIEHPEAGTLTYTGAPFGLSNTGVEDTRPAPRLGQHNKEVFSNLAGVGDAEMRNLSKRGVI